MQVRSARFRIDGGQLVYDSVLSRERGCDKPLTASLQLVLTGTAGGNDNATRKLEPVSITIGRYASLHGNRPLSARLDARQAGIQVLDRAQGQLLGQGVINLK